MLQRQCRRKVGSCKTTTIFESKPPPYPLNALEPHMSCDTLECHWGKRHRGYVENLNKQKVGTKLDGMTLENTITVTYNKGDLLPPFNNAAQRNAFGELLELINRGFGSCEGFVKEFKAAASTQFGSGWLGLHVNKANRLDMGNAVNPLPSQEDKKLVVVKSPNAINPLVWDYSPLLTIDILEHAYYLGFQNRGPDYISTFLEKLVSWETVSSRLEKAKARAAEREIEDERTKRQQEAEKTARNEAVEMYVDGESDDLESE
ncbi:Superoxide dismutase [Bertholletia excelsa]